MTRIFYDPGEEGKLTLGNLPHAPAPNLEKWTGADFLLTPLALPVLPATLPKHAEEGAAFVQVKRGHDFSASITDGRINEALARVKQHTTYAVQRIILFIGTATPADDNALLIDHRRAHLDSTRIMPYDLYLSAITGIFGKGGTFHNIPNSTYLEMWCQATLDKITKMLKEPVREQYPSKLDKGVFITDDNPLQDIRLIPNIYKVFAEMDGIGPKLIQILRDTYGHNFPAWLEELTNPALDSALRGIGKGKIAGVRDMWGLKPWQGLGVVNFPQIMADYGDEAYDFYRCSECPNRGKAEKFPVGGNWVYCDNLDCTLPKG